MDAARAAVSKITSRTGHRTEVDEVVNPAVTAEVIKPHVHEETQEAIDREVHQHHYHTTVQPIAHREVLPEKHVHNVAPQIEREFRHDNERDTAAKVEAELGQFRNTQVVTQQTRSTAVAAAVAGEHVHHHVHETVQPVIHKEVIQPEVVHTVIPIHEVHHASSEYHGISALPMKTLDEFSAAGGLVTGTKSHTHEEYDGAPRPYNEKLMTTLEKVLPTHHHHQHGTTGTTGMTGSSGYSETSGLTGSGLSGNQDRHHLGRDAAIGAGAVGTAGGLEHEHNKHHLGRDAAIGTGAAGAVGGLEHEKHKHDRNRTGDYDNYDDTNQGTGVGSSSRSGNSKPSLMDKLNPNVDSNGDGKAGFMK